MISNSIINQKGHLSIDDLQLVTPLKKWALITRKETIRVRRATYDD